MAKMKLLFLLNSMRVSGTEKLMISLSELFNENDHEVYLFPLITPFDKTFIHSLRNDGKKSNILFPSIIERLDVFFWRLNGITVSLFNWSSRSFLLRKYLSYKCKKIGVELIVSNSYTTDLFVFPLHKKTGLKYVIIDHGSYVSYIVEGTPYNSDSIQNSSAVVGVSQWTVDTLKKKFPDLLIQLVYNGYVSSSRSPVSMLLKSKLEQNGYFVFCMHGRDSRQKGWEIAINAYYILKNKGYKIKLLLLAEGEYINELRELYKEDNELIFGGFCYNLTDVFEYVNVGLMLSKKFETFGLSILDYFNSSIPVIASRVGGIPEVVHCKNLKGGYIVEVNEEGAPRAEEVSEKMEDLILDKAMYKIFSRDAKIISNHFSLRKCYSQYEQVFGEVIKK